MKKSISIAMLFLGIAVGVIGCAAEGMPTDEEMMAEEGQEIVADPGDSIGAEDVDSIESHGAAMIAEGESIALDDISPEDLAVMESGGLAGSPKISTLGPTQSSAATTCAATCDGSCKTYHGACSGWGGYMSSISCEGKEHTVYGSTKYAWMTICGSCDNRYIAGKGEGYCWW